MTGSTVVRDGELEIAMGPITLRVPVYIRYDLKEDGGDLKIAALSAFWELPAMVGQFLRGGIGALPAGLQLSKGLLVNQGLVGVLGYVGGLRGTGPQGKRRFGEFLADARAGDEVAVRRWLGKGARVTSGDDLPLSTAELLSRIAACPPPQDDRGGIQRGRRDGPRRAPRRAHRRGGGQAVRDPQDSLLHGEHSRRLIPPQVSASTARGNRKTCD